MPQDTFFFFNLCIFLTLPMSNLMAFCRKLTQNSQQDLGIREQVILGLKDQRFPLCGCSIKMKCICDLLRDRSSQRTSTFVLLWHLPYLMRPHKASGRESKQMHWRHFLRQKQMSDKGIFPPFFPFMPFRVWGHWALFCVDDNAILWRNQIKQILSEM